MNASRKRSGKGKAVAVVDPPAVPMTAAQEKDCERAETAVRARPRRAVIELKDKVLTIGSGETATLDGALLHEALGSASNQVTNHLIQRVADTIHSRGDDAADTLAIANALALVAAIAPENELEANIAVQMVAANEATMHCFRRMKGAEFMEQMAAYSNMANKAARTFALHMEALHKARRGGEQVVKHVHVYEGGQAVVADTIHNGPKRGRGRG